MARDSPECTQCGWCCVDLVNTFDASDEDIARWKLEGRNDILKYVGVGGNLFVDHETSDHVPLFCPFISFDNENRIATCQIHYTKPDVCIDFSCWNEKNGRFQVRFGDQFHPEKGYELTRKKIRREWLNYLRQLTREPSPFIRLRITVDTARPCELPHTEAMRFPASSTRLDPPDGVTEVLMSTGVTSLRSVGTCLSTHKEVFKPRAIPPTSQEGGLSGLVTSKGEHDPEDADVLNFSLLPKGCTTDRITIKRYIIERLEQQND